MVKSYFLDIINDRLLIIQRFFQKFVNESSILKNLDDIILLLVGGLLILSVFCSTDVLGLLAVVISVLSFIKLFIKKDERIHFSFADGALFIFLIILIFSTFNSTLVGPSITGLVKYCIYIAYYFSLVSLFKRKRRYILWTILLISGLCSLEAIYALLQSNTVIAGATWQDMSYINPEDAISRIYGSLKPYNPNLLAGYLIACLPVVIGATLLTIEKRHKKSFFIAIANFLIVLFAIFQTGCRGAYLAVFAIFFAYMLISYRIVFVDFKAFKKFQTLWKILVTSAVSISLIALASMPKILNRLMSIFLLRGDSSTSFRMNVYEASWNMFLDNFWFGIGLGNQTFREVYGYYMLTGFDALGAYSVPLEIAVESGIFGFLTFLIFIIALFVSAIRYICQDQSIRCKIYVSLCIVSVFGVMIHGLFDTVFFRPQIQFIFWTVVAILNVVLYRKEA